MNADGVYSYANKTYAEKGEITGKLESYILDNFLGGIPLYDSGSNVMYNSRLQGLADKYIPNFGYGVGFATINSDLEGESVSQWKRYYHTYLTDDPATFNGMNTQDSVSGDMYDTVGETYWGQRYNTNKDGYVWKPILAKENRPVALNTNEQTGMATSWRVKLHANEDGYVYNTLSTKYNSFSGRKIQLADYITPFKATLENQWVRSTELCSNSQGFVGTQNFLNAISSGKEATFEDTVTGIKLNEEEGAIDFTFITPKTQFSAMVALSSSLYAPIPEDFFTAIGGAKNFGLFSDTGVGGTGLTAVDSVLTTSAYMPEAITSGVQIVFKKNELAASAADYSIAGQYNGIYSAAKSDALYLYNLYKTEKKLDVCRVPASKLADEKNNPDVHLTDGDTVWKFQVNSCNTATWEALFGEEGSIKAHAKNADGTYAYENGWTPKAIMSNKNFLNGLYFGVDRTSLAKTIGRNAAQGFLSGAYMTDPENAVPYRDTEAGIAALAERYPESCGYSVSAAKACFTQAIAQEKAKGYMGTPTADNPYVITLDVEYQDASSVTEEGGLMKGYWEDVFNSIDPTVQLALDIKAPTIWSDVYYQYCMTGCYDLAFGSISGNTLDPNDFLNTVCSSNVSGFTLSWGTDTNAVSDDIVYDGKKWSFDALQAAVTVGAVVEDGQLSTAYYCPDVAEGGIGIVNPTIVDKKFEVKTSIEYLINADVQIEVDYVLWYDLNTDAELEMEDVSIVDSKDGTISISAKANLDNCADYGSYKDTYEVYVGYIEIFVNQTVLGITTYDIEVDVEVDVFVPLA